MTTHSQRDWQTAIKRNVIILATLIVFVISGSWGYLTWQNSKIDTLENLSENYHFAVYRNCSDIQLELRNIMFYLRPFESSVNQENLPDFIETREDLAIAFYIIAENIRIIGELQKVFNNEVFEMLNYKVANLFAILKAKQTIFEKRKYTISDELNNEFLELIISLEQLKRLHKVERAKLVRKRDLLTETNKIQLYSIIGGIVLALSLITFNIFRSIRTIIDKQKADELNLRKLSHAVECSSATVVITDTKGNIEYVNPKFTRLTGYTFEEAVGENLRIIKSGKTPPEVYKELWGNITSGKEWRGEFCNKKKNGKLYRELAYISPVKNDEGIITNFIAVKEDITERKQAEEELRKSEERFRELAENIPEVFWIASSDINRMIYISPAYEIIWGRTCKSLYERPKSWMDSIHPDDRDRVIAAIEDHIQGKADFEEEYRIICPDRSERWIIDRAYSIKGKSGLTDHIIGVAEDITERKKMEEALKDSEQRLNYALDASSDGIWDWNIVTGEVKFSRQWCESLGYDPEEVKEHVSFWENNLHPDDKEHTMKVLNDHIQGKTQIYEVENRLRMQSGEYRYNLDIGKVVEWDDEGNPVRMVGIDKDITERKKMEEALLQSEKLKSIGTITSGVAHEFNNILAIISGNVQLLEGTYKDHEELTNALRTIKRVTNDGAEISKRMLRFTRTKKDTTGFVLCEIRDLIEQAVDFTMPRRKNMAQVKGINYYIDRDDMKEIPAILCNPTELREVFINIINNALDAMPDGGRISFSTWSEEDTVFISISDKGEGMSEAVRKSIFDNHIVGTFKLTIYHNVDINYIVNNFLRRCSNELLCRNRFAFR